MPSMTYICKSCGARVTYPSNQDQDQQPTVQIDQAANGVTIIIKHPNRVDPEVVLHDCRTEDIDRPGIHFNLPAQ